MVNSIVVPGLAVALLTALQMIAQKHIAHRMSHQTLFVLASLGYFIMTLFYIGYHKELIQKEVRTVITPVILILTFSVVVGFGANMLYFSILKDGQASLLAALTSTAPLFVAGLSVLVLNEVLELRQFAGIAAIVGGTVLLSQS